MYSVIEVHSRTRKRALCATHLTAAQAAVAARRLLDKRRRRYRDRYALVIEPTPAQPNTLEDPLFYNESEVKYIGRAYTGEVHRYENGTRVLLDPRLDLVAHNRPVKLAWGYGGAGPTQLAVALCADATGDDARALRVYQEFACDVVARLGTIWILTRREVLTCIQRIERGSGE